MLSCKCSKSDTEMTVPPSPFFGEMTTRMEERRGDLVHRQKCLADKITTLERSIPALMAYNMWMSDQDCDAAPFCKIRQLMQKFSPHTDPTEKLLASLRQTLKELQGETKDLHEKIIDTDVKLEETDMEIESLELANKEMGDTVNELEKEVKSYTTPSLHSIHSDDVICLSKIKELAKEEVNLKRCIKELEKRETVFSQQIEHLLTTKEFENACMGEKVGGRGGHALNDGNVQSTFLRRRGLHAKTDNTAECLSCQKPEVANETKLSWIVNWLWKGKKSCTSQTDRKNQQADLHKMPSSCVCRMSCADSTVKSRKKSTAMATRCPYSACFPLDGQSPTGNRKCSCNVIVAESLGEKKLPAEGAKSQAPCLRKHLALSEDVKPFGHQKISEFRGCIAASPCARNPCNIRTPNETCKTAVCKTSVTANSITAGCRCNCKGKCAMGLTDVPCNCSSNYPGDKEYQPRPTGFDQVGTCNCCSCNSEDSDVSLL